MNEKRWIGLVSDVLGLGDLGQIKVLEQSEADNLRRSWWEQYCQTVPWVEPPWDGVTNHGVIGGSSVVYGVKAREGYSSLETSEVILVSQSPKLPALSIRVDSMPSIECWDDLQQGGFVAVFHPDFFWSLAFYPNRLGFPTSPSLAVPSGTQY